MNRIYIFGITSAKGGIESLMHALLLDLVHKRDASSLIIVSSYPTIAFEEEYLQHGVQVRHIPARTSKKEYKDALKAVFSEMDQTDLAYLNLSTFCNWTLLRITKKANCKVLLHGHNAHTENLAKIILHRIGRTLYASQGTKVAVSESCNKFMFGGKADYVIYNGIESNRFYFDLKDRHAVRQELKLDEDRIVVGCLGRISPEKNQLELVKKASSYPDITFLFLGAFMGDAYESEVRANASPNCIFVGQVDEVGRHLSALDAIVMPSKYEGFPLAAAEALTNGLPVFVLKELYPSLPAPIRDNPKAHPFEEKAFNLARLKESKAIRDAGQVEHTCEYDVRSFLDSMEAIIREE